MLSLKPMPSFKTKRYKPLRFVCLFSKLTSANVHSDLSVNSTSYAQCNPAYKHKISSLNTYPKYLASIKSQAGFTLIEVMVALTILAVVAIAASRASGTYLRSTEQLTNRTMAQFTLNNVVAEMQMTGNVPDLVQTKQIAAQGRNFVVTITPATATNATSAGTTNSSSNAVSSAASNAASATVQLPLSGANMPLAVLTLTAALAPEQGSKATSPVLAELTTVMYRKPANGDLVMQP